MCSERKSTQFIPEEKKKSIGSYQWAVVRGRDKGAAGREFGCWSQTADHACWISQWATAGRWYVFSSQYALNIIPGPYMHMDIWLWEYVVGCAYLCVRVLHMRMILILCVLCECVCPVVCVSGCENPSLFWYIAVPFAVCVPVSETPLSGWSRAFSLQTAEP